MAFCSRRLFSQAKGDSTMKQSIKVKWLGLAILTIASLQAQAATGTVYQLTVTNGSSMPISPLVAYVKNGQTGKTQVGMAPSAGFIQLCLTGDPALRIQELSKLPDVTATAQTMGALSSYAWRQSDD
jgi:hypothetical protein